MKINKHNYEAFFLDYQEGNLDEHQVAELMLFLSQNPEIEQEFNEFLGEEIRLETPLEVYHSKNRLKKQIVATQNISDENYEELLVAAVDNELSFPQKVELETFIEQNPFVEKELSIYEKTILSAPQVGYANKETLKRKTRVVPLFWVRSISVAASVALLLGLFFMKFNTENQLYRTRKHSFTTIEFPGFPQHEPSKYSSSKIVLAQSSNPVSYAKEPKESDFNIAVPVLEKEQKPLSTTEKLQPNSVENNIAVWIPKQISNDENNIAEVSAKEYLKTVLNKKVLKENERADEPVKNNLLVRLVKTSNKLFKTKLRLEKSYNEAGELYAYTINSGRFNLNKKVLQ